MQNKEVNMGDWRARFQMNPRREMLGFAHREVARNQVKCLLFHSIIVEYQDEI